MVLKAALCNCDKIKAIKLLSKRFAFHHPVISRVAAELMYRFPNEERKRSVHQVLEVLGADTSGSWKKNDKLVKDILFAKVCYAIVYKEYYLYGFDRLPDPQRTDYVGWIELEHYYDAMNAHGNPDVFESKEKTYDAFREFYRRELVYVGSEQQKDQLHAFFARHKTGIIKPTGSYGGQGVEIVTADGEQGVERLWERIRDRCPLVVEELIEQAPEMNVFYPNAVNTIRYNTFFHNGQLIRMQAVFRIGRGGSNVDNATSGGIYALVDTETGRILGPARSFRAESFERHPDTGVVFEGSTIPRWNELNDLVERVVQVVPEQKQVGWDFALSKDGWVMVEGNTMPVLQSFDLDHGLRNLVTDTFGKVVPIWK